jgi:ethanolamine permease
MPPEDGGTELRRTLGPLTLWGLGVGYVISGMYFGWNLGLPAGGTHGLLAATALVTVLYVCFVLAYAELACAVPRAGGAFVYAERAFGPTAGFVAGLAQCVEFVFAPPAIAAAIGAYLSLFVDGLPPLAAGAAAYVLFTAVNVHGVKLSAGFELGVTALAVLELLIFAGLTLPRFDASAFNAEALPHGWWGVMPALPFAIWFYLGIEGVANVAEEAEDPQRDVPRGFGSAMATLVALAATTFLGAVGVAGWRHVVYPEGSSEPSDSPLPLALRAVVGAEHPMFHLLIVIGLFGLVASFHGLVLVAGRATFEMGRMGYLPRRLGRVVASRGTPALALLANMAVGLIALWTGRTAEIIVVAVFGALTMYAVSMGAFFRLRRKEPLLPRPFRTPLVPVVPATALVLSLGCLAALFWYNPVLGLVYVGMLAAGVAWFRAFVRPGLAR